jgi:hypothetical protein
MSNEPCPGARPDFAHRLRFDCETAFADELAATGIFRKNEMLTLPDDDTVRRSLLTTHLRLSEGMAPEIFRWSEMAARALGLAKPVEIYQAAGEGNAANHTCEGVVFVSLQGRLISSLDEGSFLALFGHEFGHHIAHTSPFVGTTRLAAIRFGSSIACDASLSSDLRVLGSRVAMAKEITADRFGAIATGGIDGAVRLMMAIVTGLPAERLRNDIPAYLAQARAIFDDSKAKTKTIGTHPEHLLRAYALALFSESDLYKELTGQGTGARTISEVDAILKTILVGEQGSMMAQIEDAGLPPELQEFALAAAVLIASADDAYDEAESKILEETFADIIPNWKELMDADVALARFNELLPLALAGGEPVALAVFNILIHMMLADREIHVRELEVLSAVGRALHQEHLFQYLLAAVAREIRIERSDSSVERPLPAIQPGKHEAHAAIEALFAGLARRGGGDVSLARLLRILGESTWRAELWTVIESTASRHQLEAASPPSADESGNVRTAQSLIFRLTEDEIQRREKAAALEPSDGIANAKDRDSLLTALKHLRERLVSGDGRSPSIRLYRAASGRHFDLARLDGVITGRSERIATQLYDSTTLPLLSGDEAGLSKASADLARLLRSLDREAKARVEETGARDLHLGYPFLIGKVGSFFVRAPLILHPFSLHGDSRGGGSYQLKRGSDEAPLANQALLRLLFAKKGFPFTEELATELDEKAGVSPDALLAALRDLGLDPRPLSGAVSPFEDMSPSASDLLPDGVSLAENAVIGFFPQSSSDLLQDYDELLQRLDPKSTDSLEGSLNAACDLLPSSHRPGFSPVSDPSDPDQPVIYSDPSQRAAVRTSRATRLLVVDGPPGTGKSQTIVNLVADTLARGGKVAVVCEKRVALDVVKQRLNQAGLGHLSAVVHDVQDDRKALYTHIADRLEAPERRMFDASRITQLRMEAEEIEAALATRARLLATATRTGMTLGQLHAFASSRIGSFAFPQLDLLPIDQLAQMHRHLCDIQPHARLLGSSSPFHSAESRRAALAHATDEDLRKISEGLQNVRDAIKTYHQAYAENPVHPDALEAAGEALDFIATLPQSDPMFDTALTARLKDPTKAAVIEQGFAALNEHRSLLLEEKSRIRFTESPELLTSLADARIHVSSFFKFLKPAWRKAKANITASLHRDWPESAGRKLDAALLGAIDRRLNVSRAWSGAAALFESLGIASQLPTDAAALVARCDDMKRTWEYASRLKGYVSVLDPLEITLPMDQTALRARAKALRGLLTAQRAYHLTARDAAATFPQVLILDPDQLDALASSFQAESSNLRLADRVLEIMGGAFSPSFELVSALADHLPDASPERWCETTDRAWAEAHLRATEASDPALSVLDQTPPLGSVEAASARLLDLHKQIATQESLRISATGDQTGLMAIAPAEARARRTPVQTARENLIKETRKQRNVTPMRTLIRRHAREILDVVPVWLMSPETTAILFPREPIFDLLIIDEASQCTVENGLPVLTRARRAVVSGDDKQMPPTSFFKSGNGLEIDENSEAEVAPDTFDSESLLVLARMTGAGAPLRWHYRALFEELIAFSNHSMYGGSLLTIPATLSRSAPSAIRWVKVKNGEWDKGVNIPEAKRVVDLLGEILARPKPPTVGIVTFNLSQRRAILDEIDARRANDEKFSALWDVAASRESLDERPFVKNLESVQGDERELILFSLGYAPVARKRKDGTEDTYVPARFGPLGQKGGERRLNVAVSRAKSEIIVVSSFDPSMLSVAHTKHDGPRFFKAFVEFARHLGEGRRTQAEKILSLINDRRASSSAPANGHAGDYLPLHHQIALALEKEGLTLETLVGTSEFRLPVAVVSDGNAHRYTLAILCEDGTGSVDVYEDYVHVPNVLAHRGWKHLRVTAREWHRDPQAVINRVRKGLSASHDAAGF